jgi:hypothetical protein
VSKEDEEEEDVVVMVVVVVVTAAVEVETAGLALDSDETLPFLCTNQHRVRQYQARQLKASMQPTVATGAGLLLLLVVELVTFEFLTAVGVPPIDARELRVCPMRG